MGTHYPDPKCRGDQAKALFYVHRTIINNWSRAVLMIFLDINLYERQGKAVTNFAETLPATQSDLAQAITNSPQALNERREKTAMQLSDLTVNEKTTNERWLSISFIILVCFLILNVTFPAKAESSYTAGIREFSADAYYEVMESCAGQIREKTDFTPEIVIVLGSGLGDFADRIEIVDEIPYSEITGFPVSTAPGHEGKLVFGTYKGKKLVIMKGRIHYYEGYSMADVVLPLRTLHLLGAHTAILTCSAGSLNEEYHAGEFLVLDDHITAFVPSPLIGDNVDELGERFIDMTCVYDKELRDLAMEAAQENSIPAHSGVYIQVSGPQYETPTECRMYRSFDADAIGMSTAVEAVAAKHMGMKVCAISCLTCMGAGMEDVQLSHEEVEKNAEQSSSDFIQLITTLLEKMPE